LNKAINISIYNVFNPANKNIFEQHDHEGHCLAEAGGGLFRGFLLGGERGESLSYQRNESKKNGVLAQGG
jgi:hypothetical protein